MDAPSTPVSILQGKEDRYGGFIIEPTRPSDLNSFVLSLRKSLAHWKSQRKKGIWLKLPLQNANLVFSAIEAEDIISGVIREVKEETGVDAEFIDVVGFRQSHNAVFGKSDLFFICMLRPTSSQITIQETEIAAAKWMPLEEFGAQPFNMASSMMRRVLELATASMEGRYHGFSPERLQFGFRKKGSYFYHNIADLSGSSQGKL